VVDSGSRVVSVLPREGSRRRSEEMRHQREERDETTLVGLTQTLLGRKMKKIYVDDSIATNRQ
jgi:hypothetical protein